MHLVQVEDKKTARRFLEAARTIYRGDPAWICPPDEIIDNIFDPRFNRYFVKGEAIRWILTDEAGALLGRIAAFYHRENSYRWAYPVGGIGFFECIDNQPAADILFTAGMKWLESRGMKAMDGPINFGENDNFWGLLVEGFTPPAYGMNYHKPYYKRLFETFGFKPFYIQITKHLDLSVPFPERFWKIAEWVMKKPGFTFRHFTFRDVDRFVDDLIKIHEEAWAKHENYTTLDRDLVYREFRKSRSILVPEFIWFVYHDERPVAFFVMLPDVNQILRHFNGSRNWLDRLRFIYYQWRKEITRARITIMGVAPSYQGQGLESAIFWHLREPVLVRRPHIKEIEISWVGDFNPKMRATLEAVGANPGKTHITYRKIFSHDIEFQAAKTISPGVKVK